MTGAVTVVGAAPGGAERAVARALGRRVLAPWTLGPAGDADESVMVLPAAGTPLVAARHVSASLDPRELVERVRSTMDDDGDGEGQVAIALEGGPLAPLTPRYAVRDLARELELPAVVAVEAHPGFPGLALAATSVLRAAGVRVAGVVVCGWPDPPNRVQLDERDVLRDVADVPVEVAAARGGRVDVSAWLAAAEAPPRPPQPTAAPEAPRAPVHEVVLEPYRAWEARPVGDPRGTPRPQIMAAMLEIVGAEGPMTANRAYALYNRSAGGKKLTSIARAPLSSALYWLARDGKVILTREEEIPWQGGDLVRLPDAAAVRVRELGPRSLDEVPLDEIAELIRRLRDARGISRPDQLKRAVLDAYGLIRLTAKADEYLGLALDLAG